MTSLAVFDALMSVLLGGVLGVVGQGIRAVVGIKKLLEAGKADEFSWSILGLSLLLGFIAGALAIIGADTLGAKVGAAALLAIIFAGYAGADFIEGMMRRAPP